MLKPSQKGFTLLELMISITLIGIVVLIVFGAMRLGYRSIEKAERTMDFLERVRTSLNIIEAQIQSNIPLTYEEDGEKKLYFTGQKESMQFSTNYSIWSGQRGYIKVIYNIEQDANGRRALYATENTISLEDTRKTMLLDGLEGVSFKYFFKDSLKQDGEWRDGWTETSSLPEMVSVNIFDSSRKLSVNMLVRIKNKTSQSTAAPTPIPDPKRRLPRQGSTVKY